MISMHKHIFNRRVEFYVDDYLRIDPDTITFWTYSMTKKTHIQVQATAQEARAVIAAFQCELLQTGELCPESKHDVAVDGEQVQEKAWDDYPGEKW